MKITYQAITNQKNPSWSSNNMRKKNKPLGKKIMIREEVITKGYAKQLIHEGD